MFHHLTHVVAPYSVYSVVPYTYSYTSWYPSGYATYGYWGYGGWGDWY